MDGSIMAMRMWIYQWVNLKCVKYAEDSSRVYTCGVPCVSASWGRERLFRFSWILLEREKRNIRKSLITPFNFCTTLKSVRRQNYMNIPLTEAKAVVSHLIFFIFLTHLLFCMSASLDGRNPGGSWCAAGDILFSFIFILIGFISDTGCFFTGTP